MFANYNLIDFHTHCFPEKIANSTINALKSNSGSVAFTDGTLLGLECNLINAGGVVAVNLPVLTKPTQFDSVTKFAIEINKKFNSGECKVLSFGGIHPACEDIEGKMQYLKDNGILGVKIHPDYQGTYIDDQGYIKILTVAKKLDMVVVTHAGVDEGYKGKPVMCPPDRLVNVIKQVNHGKFVLGHFGANLLWQEVFDKIAGLDVYLDTAYTLNVIDRDLFVKIIEKHGVDKVLFATDCPWRDIKNYKEILLSFNLPDEWLKKIFYENAKSLLKL